MIGSNPRLPFSQHPSPSSQVLAGLNGYQKHVQYRLLWIKKIDYCEWVTANFGLFCTPPLHSSGRKPQTPSTTVSHYYTLNFGIVGPGGLLGGLAIGHSQFRWEYIVLDLAHMLLIHELFYSQQLWYMSFNKQQWFSSRQKCFDRYLDLVPLLTTVILPPGVIFSWKKQQWNNTKLIQVPLVMYRACFSPAECVKSLSTHLELRNYGIFLPRMLWYKLKPWLYTHTNTHDWVHELAFY